MGCTPNMYAMLADKSRLGLLPRCYYDHKLVKRAEDVIVLPLCLYVDGIQYTDRDNLISFYVHNVATDCRHLVVAIRKNDVCKCGCKGWCSIWGTHTFLRWTFRALAAGVWPDRKHDGHEWTDDYQFRASFANAPLGLTAVAVMVKSDWHEFCDVRISFAQCGRSPSSNVLCSERSSQRPIELDTAERLWTRPQDFANVYPGMREV